MQEVTDDNEQAFLDACEAVGVEPGEMLDTLKKRFVATDFRNDPLVWLEAELPYHAYTTRGEAQDVANRIDRMIHDRQKIGDSKYACSARAFKDEIGYSVRVLINRALLLV